MLKRRYEGLEFNGDDDEYKVEDIPGFKEAGWTKKAYEIAK